MTDYMEKAKILTEALPYIKKFRGKTVVIKYGGSAMKNPKIKKSVMEDIALMKLVGIRIILVHGGGAEINSTLKKMNIKSKFIDGLRVTDKETMDVVEMVLAGHVNKKIVNDIQKHNLNAIGLCGKDCDALIAKKVEKKGIDLGFVGEVTKVNTTIFQELMEHDIIPVIAPIGKDENGENTYNINADYAAAAIAEALNAEKLIYLTDVEGVLRDVEDSSSIIYYINTTEAKEYINNGMISGGMIPKVENCIKAIKNGVKAVHIINGGLEHCIVLELFTESGIGTMFSQ